MNRLNFPIKWKYFVFGILLGFLFSGLLLIIKLKPVSGELQLVTPSPINFESRTEKQDETSVNEGKININLATHEELVTLPGIGEAKASAIIVYRDKYGAFESAEELLYVPGIGEKQLSAIKSLIVIP